MNAAVRHKQADRGALMLDVEYFSSELIARLERLAKIDKSWRVPLWAQASAMVRRVRALGRHQADEQKRKAKRAAMREERNG